MNNQSEIAAVFRDAIRAPVRSTPAADASTLPALARRPDKSLFLLATDRIRRDEDQVRRSNKSAADPEVRELAESIKALGIENPLTVRFISDANLYELIAGERRFTAAQLIGLKEVPVKLVDVDEPTAKRLQLHENIHRAALLPLELSVALNALANDGMTTDELAKLLCKSKPYVSKALAIGQRLTPAAQKTAATSRASQSLDILYEISQAPADEQVGLLDRIEREGLNRVTVRELTAQAKIKSQATDAKRRGRRPKTRDSQQTIHLADGASIVVRVPMINASRVDFLAALRRAVEQLER